VSKPIQQRVRLIRKHRVQWNKGKCYYEATFRVEVAWGTFLMKAGIGWGRTEEEARNDAKRLAYGAAWEHWEKSKRAHHLDTYD
jgi:hypothetical protein